MDAEAYSESKIVTTGILDHPLTLSLVPTIFFKTLAYALFKDKETLGVLDKSKTPVPPSILSACWKKFPVKWLEFLNKGRGEPESETVVGQSEADQCLMIICVACYVTLMGICAYAFALSGINLT